MIRKIVYNGIFGLSYGQLECQGKRHQVRNFEKKTKENYEKKYWENYERKNVCYLNLQNHSSEK